MFLLEDLHKTVSFHSLLTFGDVVGFFIVWPYLSSWLIPAIAQAKKHLPAWECHRGLSPPFYTQLCDSFLWKGGCRDVLLSWLGVLPQMPVSMSGWARLVCGSRGRFAMQSRSTRAGCTMAAHQEAVVVSRQWGNSSVHWEWQRCALLLD